MHMVNEATMLDRLFAGDVDRNYGMYDEEVHDENVNSMKLFGQVFDVSAAGTYVHAAMSRGEVSPYRDCPTVTPPFPQVFLECQDPLGPLTKDEKELRSGGYLPKRLGLAVVSARADAIFGAVEDVPVRPERIKEILESYLEIEEVERERVVLREEDVDSTRDALSQSRVYRVPLGRGKAGGTNSTDIDLYDEFLQSRITSVEEEGVGLYMADPKTGRFDLDVARHTATGYSLMSLLVPLHYGCVYTSETGSAVSKDNAWPHLELAERYVAGTSRAPHHVVNACIFLENYGRSGVTPAVGIVSFAVDRSGRLCPSLVRRSDDGLPDAFSFSTPLLIERFLGLPAEALESLYLGMFGATMTIASCALTFLNCTNVPVDTVEPRSKSQKKHSKKHRTPLVTKKVLRLLPTQRTRTVGEDGERLDTSVRDERALHIVRGHFKTYSEKTGLLFGKYAGTYFWGPQVRGNSKKGLVEKDYFMTQEQVALGAEQTAGTQAAVPSVTSGPTPSPTPTQKPSGKPKTESRYVSEKRRPRRNDPEKISLEMLRRVS